MSSNVASTLFSPQLRAIENVKIAFSSRDSKDSTGPLVNIAKRVTRVFLAIIEFCFLGPNYFIAALDKRCLFPNHSITVKTTTIPAEAPPTVLPNPKTAHDDSAPKEKEIEDSQKTIPSIEASEPKPKLIPAETESPLIIEPITPSQTNSKPKNDIHHNTKLLQITGIASLSLMAIGLYYVLQGTGSVQNEISNINIIPDPQPQTPLYNFPEPFQAERTDTTISSPRIFEKSPNYDVSSTTVPLFGMPYLSDALSNISFASLKNILDSHTLALGGSAVAIMTSIGSVFAYKKCTSKEKKEPSNIEHEPKSASSSESASPSVADEFAQGEALEKYGEFEKAFILYKKAAEKNNPRALEQLFTIFWEEAWLKFDPSIQEIVWKSGRKYLVDEGINWGKKASEAMERARIFPKMAIDHLEMKLNMLKNCQAAMQREMELQNLQETSLAESSKSKEIFGNCLDAAQRGCLHAIHYMVSCSAEEERFKKTFALPNRLELYKHWSDIGLRKSIKDNNPENAAYFQQHLGQAEMQVQERKRRAQEAKQAKLAKQVKEPSATTLAPAVNEKTFNLAEYLNYLNDLSTKASVEKDPYLAGQIAEGYFKCYQICRNKKDQWQGFDKNFAGGRLSSAVIWIKRAIDWMPAKMEKGAEEAEMEKHSKALEHFKKLRTEYETVNDKARDNGRTLS